MSDNITITDRPQKETVTPHWFAMRATYRGELMMKQKLEDKNLTCFIPLAVKEKIIKGRKKRILAPAVASLVFVYGTQQAIQDFKNRETRLQYICKTTLDGRHKPIIVPDSQMEAFIRLYEAGSCEISNNSETLAKLQHGARVRVVAGPFIGMEGTFQRVKGHRNKQFVITIDCVACVSTAIVTADMIEPIKQAVTP